MINNLIKLLGTMLLVCVAYKLNVISIILCLVITAYVGIIFNREERRRVRYLNKFNDIVLYMEQLSYSFKKHGKIRPSLIDVQKVSSKEMKEIIEEVTINIDSQMSDNIYEDSLKIIQDEYDCKRLRSLHEFIIKIENHGGEFESYIDILLEDIKEWNERTQFFIKDVDRVKRNVLISIISTLITCGFMAYLIPKEYNYTGHILYQLASTIMVILMLATYIGITKKLNFDWIKEPDTISDNYIVRYYILVEKGYKNMKQLTFMEKITYKTAKKRIENEISKAFPDWLRDVAINLHNDTVQSAIENSYDDAPFILKRPIRNLLIDFEQYPVGIEPYENFLKEFDLKEIKSSMKMFYSINELGKEQSDKQINSILDRNDKMARRAESMKNKDRIGMAGMLATIPMLLGVLKIMVDMILMILVFTSSISNVVNGG